MLRDDDLKMELNSYENLVGKLPYLAYTRLDISYSVNGFESIHA